MSSYLTKLANHLCDSGHADMEGMTGCLRVDLPGGVALYATPGFSGIALPVDISSEDGDVFDSSEVRMVWCGDLAADARAWRVAVGYKTAEIYRKAFRGWEGF